MESGEAEAQCSLDEAGHLACAMSFPGPDLRGAAPVKPFSLILGPAGATFPCGLQRRNRVLF